MVGRSDELGRLRDALARAEAGSPTAVIVSGEAGIGKTRLVGEFVASAGVVARVIRGGCIPLADGLQPLAPVVEMLQSLGPQVGREDEGDLLGALLPELGLAPAPHEMDQHRLFAALRRLLDRLATAQTLVVVLEDLHWADPSTRSLLAYLVHGMRAGDSRLLLVGTCRSDELSRGHPLRSLLAELNRAGVARIELAGLGPADTMAQIEGILKAPVDAALSERMHARCGGNPFLVEELLAAGPENTPLPERTRDILLERVRRLPGADRRLLQAIAVAGRRAEHDLLARVMGSAGDELLERLRTAVEEQILVVVDDGYAFRHALVAEALMAEALPGERVALHRAYAEALSQRWDGEAPAWKNARAAELAHHWYLAGEPVRGLLASIDAGLAAERLFAQPEAREHFDRAIKLWDEAPQARPGSPLDLVELCRHGAQAAYLDGDIDHAIALVRRALSEAGPDPLRAGILHERLGRYLWANGKAESESIGAYQRAVELTPPGPSPQRARVLTGLASALTYADRPDALAWCEEALRVASAAGARGEEGRALQSLGYCRAMAGDVEGGLMHCRRALAIAAQLDQSDELYRAYACLVGVLRMAGRTAEAASTAMEGVDVARRRGADRTYGNLLLGDAIEAMILLGRWDEADGLLPGEPDVVAHGTPVIATNLWLSAANLHTWRGRFELSQRFLDACMVAYAKQGHGHVRSMLHANLSELCIWQGKFAEASRWIHTELDLLGTIEFTSLLSRLVLQGLRAEAELTRPYDLTRLVCLLEEMSRRPDPPPDAAAIIALSWAELSRVRGEPDSDLWTTAAEQMTKLDMPWPVSYAQWRLAEVLLAGRPAPTQRQAGAAALSEANAIAIRLGAEPLRQEIVALARRTRLLSAIGPAQREATGHTLLTEREHEVLQLICAGATNRRIAQQLFISEKTVSIHVSRILEKLGATNRGEAAAIARRMGLP
jgi:DNA-binding CsgD family transcriptional regulator/tetratricopeptide (TPR) repeat protein